MYLGGRKVLDPSEVEQRRQTLSDTRLARLGELADAEELVRQKREQVTRLEGGIMALEEVLAMMTPPAEPEKEEPEEES
jgi:hypothetical protein